MTAEKLSTTDRILEASLKLFNEHGYQNIAALRIAQHLEISHGNLAYHFKTKHDIVLAVFPLLEKAVREVRAPGGRLRARDAAIHQAEIFRTLWRYRFFFNALTQLLTRSEKLRQRFFELEDRVLGTLQELLEDLIVQGDMRPVKLPTTTRILARCCWMTWLSWLRFEQIQNPAAETARADAVYDGVMLNFAIVQAYFSDDFANQMFEELQKAVLGDAAAA